MNFKLIGIGAVGPGFQNWSELGDILDNEPTQPVDRKFVTPKPDVIPANERRRAPLPVKIAVEVSEQALKQSKLSSNDFACVFGSGLGDTQITDYMCRALNTEEKLLSPTKFHNSVHNAAAGYWTISTDCMQAANSITAYHDTVGMCLLEAAAQIKTENTPVLVTVFDIGAFSAYAQIFECDQHFGAALALAPIDYPSQHTLAHIEVALEPKSSGDTNTFESSHLAALFDTNPSAKILSLLSAIKKHHTLVRLSVSEKQALKVMIEPC